MRGAAPEFFWQEDVVPWVDLHQVFEMHGGAIVDNFLTNQFCERVLMIFPLGPLRPSCPSASSGDFALGVFIFS
jgi:hypothetical protein